LRPPNGAQPDRTVALVHDFLLDLRGAERVLLELCEMWPHAPIFTTVYDDEGTEGWFAGRTLHTSFLQRTRPSSRTFRALLPFYPAAVESFDLSEYDLVISSSSAWAHGVVVAPSSVHVSYCHNPFRYAWNERERTLGRWRDPVTRACLDAIFRRWREWDRRIARRTDRYVANSRTTQARIRTFFERESAVVHPPVQVERFAPGHVGDHYVLVSELLAHKQVDVAIAAFNRLQLPLVIIGDGPDARRLRRQAGPTIQFAGRVSDRSVTEIMRSARALVQPSTEEFGIAAVESQAAGRPVIARRAGGALETVLDGTTGRLWQGGPEDLARTVTSFDDAAVDPQICVRNAGRFDAASFRAGITAEVASACASRLDPAASDGRGAFGMDRLPEAAPDIHTV
jgi:glycosyltransferase involved in cell wall biosynthesis